MPSSNTLELAKRGDPAAIATILSYHLTQHYNLTASVIRLGDYLSVFVEADLLPAQPTVVALICAILKDLDIEGIQTVEISGRKANGQEVLWNQTIEQDHLLSHHAAAMNDAPISTLITSPPDLAPQSSSEALQSVVDSVESASDHSHLVVEDATLSQANDDEWSTLLHKLLQRPEMIALFTFAIAIALWEIYIDQSIKTDLAQPISGVKLARRLGVHNSTISRYKLRSNFPEWSQDLDPDGISWAYDGKTFMPMVRG